MALPRNHREKPVEKWTKGDWIDEANAQREDKEVHATRLGQMLEASESLLADIDHGSFNEDEFRTEVARTRVHLAEYEALP